MSRSVGGSGGRPGGRKTSSQRSAAGAREPEQYAVEPVRVDVGKRAVALVIDFAAAYLVGVVVALVPFVNNFLPVTFTLVIVMLTRDYFFDGRGLGKNLMGLQVVDLYSGKPCSLLQSIERNIILLAPFVVLQGIGLVLRFVPIAWLNNAVVNLVNIAGMVYCAVVIPLEAYRVYNREDGLRIGDDIAGTGVVESTMDFSNFLPRG